MSFESLTPPPQNERRPEPRVVFSQTAGPTSEPVSASDLRAHAHLDDNDDTAALGRLLVPAPPRVLTMHAVSTDVGNVRNHGPHLIDPIPADEVIGGLAG